MVEPQSGDRIRALVRRYANGRSITRIERDAGMGEKTISRYTTPSTSSRNLLHMPSAVRLGEIADALGAPLSEVVGVFLSEARIQAPDGPEAATPEEAEVVTIMRRLGSHERGLIRDCATLIEEYAKSVRNGDG